MHRDSVEPAFRVQSSRQFSLQVNRAEMAETGRFASSKSCAIEAETFLRLSFGTNHALGPVAFKLKSNLIH
jgi:hypothetical protein